MAKVRHELARLVMGTIFLVIIPIRFSCLFLRQFCRDVASGADRHLDITFGLQVVESSSVVSVLFREAFSHPYISFIHLLINGSSVTSFHTISTTSSLPYIGGQ